MNKSPVSASFSHLDADSTIGSFSLIQNTWKQIRVYFPAIKENCSILFISNAQKLSLVSKVIGSAMVFLYWMVTHNTLRTCEGKLGCC